MFMLFFMLMLVGFFFRESIVRDEEVFLFVRVCSGGEGDGEDGASARIFIVGDGAFVHVDQFAGEVEAYSGAVAGEVALHEALEQFAPFLLGYADAGV